MPDEGLITFGLICIVYVKPAYPGALRSAFPLLFMSPTDWVLTRSDKKTKSAYLCGLSFQLPAPQS